jgi:5-hydroxyisourate hydrolase
VSTVTTHVLDIALGRPAAGVAVRLERGGGDGDAVGVATTDADGRIAHLGPGELPAGRYRLVFATGAYFAGTGRQSFHPRVSVEFEIAGPDQHFHVPLLVSPYGYTTYRGS